VYDMCYTKIVAKSIASSISSTPSHAIDQGGCHASDPSPRAI
jgi:hypothetical protein